MKAGVSERLPKSKSQAGRKPNRRRARRTCWAVLGGHTHTWFQLGSSGAILGCHGRLGQLEAHRPPPPGAASAPGHSNADGTAATTVAAAAAAGTGALLASATWPCRGCCWCVGSGCRGGGACPCRCLDDVSCCCCCCGAATACCWHTVTPPPPLPPAAAAAAGTGPSSRRVLRTCCSVSAAAAAACICSSGRNSSSLGRMSP